MAEQLSKVRKGWKIWKNPVDRKASVAYLGEVFAPEETLCITAKDLRELGFGPGEYTVLAPKEFSHQDVFCRWQRVSIREC